MRLILAAAFAVTLGGAAATGALAQSLPAPAESGDHVEARAFMDAYAADLRNADHEAVIARYDPAGAWVVQAGQAEWLTLAQITEVYSSEAWRPPADFAWQDLVFVPVGDDVVTVIGRFSWPRADGSPRTIAYHGLLVRTDGQWRIRVEDETAVAALR